MRDFVIHVDIKTIINTRWLAIVSWTVLGQRHVTVATPWFARSFAL